MEDKVLARLKRKESAKIKKILGGEETEVRLEALGIRPGKSVTMISTHFWGGPVTIMIDKAKVAIGRKMAERIIIED